MAVVEQKKKMVEQTLGLDFAEQLGDKQQGEKLSAGEVEKLRSLLPDDLLPEGDLTQLEVKILLKQHKDQFLFSFFIRLYSKQ